MRYDLQSACAVDDVDRFAVQRKLAAERFAIGTPTQVSDMLVAQHRVGITHASMRVSWPGMRQADILAGIETLGRDVLPDVRRRTGPSIERNDSTHP